MKGRGYASYVDRDAGRTGNKYRATPYSTVVVAVVALP